MAMSPHMVDLSGYPDLGMRQYWRDFDSLVRWARSEPHRERRQSFARDSRGSGRARRQGVPDVGAPVGEP